MTNKGITLISVGEILWDVLPDGKVLGGAPANVAWHALQLGADAHLASAVGDDANGLEILAKLKEMGLNAATVAIVPGKPTSTVDAVLDADGNARYAIHADVAWDSLPATPEMIALASRADAVAFGSLAQRSPAGRDAVRRILDAARPDALRIFDINLRPPHFSGETLHAGLERANVLKMNHDELPVVSGLFGLPAEERAALPALMLRYPNLRRIIVTCGSDGALWYDQDGIVRMPPPRAVAVADTVGAGDSFTAAVVLGLLKNWSRETVLSHAIATASFVCSRRGATPRLPEEITRLFAAHHSRLNTPENAPAPCSFAPYRLTPAASTTNQGERQ